MLLPTARDEVEDGGGGKNEEVKCQKFGGQCQDGVVLTAATWSFIKESTTVRNLDVIAGADNHVAKRDNEIMSKPMVFESDEERCPFKYSMRYHCHTSISHNTQRRLSRTIYQKLDRQITERTFHY